MFSWQWRQKNKFTLHIFALPLLISFGLYNLQVFITYFFCSFEKTLRIISWDVTDGSGSVFGDAFTTPIFLKQLKGVSHIAACNNETDCGNQLEFH